jgi:putative endonuclease
MTNKKDGTLYTGVTSDLIKRTYEHRNHLIKGFTAKYNCITLVYYELHGTMLAAITREKQIKAGSRAEKIRLIENMNPDWCDLYVGII